jgi:hypothetical protein
MSNDPEKVNRRLHIKITTPSADSGKLLASMMKTTAAMYEAFGGVRIRLLRNVDDPAQFVQVIEYQASKTLDAGRQKIAGDPMTRNIVQAWRSLFPGAIQIDEYEDVTESV